VSSRPAADTRGFSGPLDSGTFGYLRRLVWSCAAAEVDYPISRLQATLRKVSTRREPARIIVPLR
jgi:hypothetical protein